jgi:hypothetical protein
VTKGPGEDSLGGVTFRPGWWAKLRNLRKPGESNPLLRVSVLGYATRTNRVAGGVAWTKWLTTLTGESPTSSAARLRPGGGNANL